MTFDDVRRLQRYWAKYPPVRDLLAAAIEFKIPTDFAEAEAETSTQYMTAEDLKHMMAMTGGRIPGMD